VSTRIGLSYWLIAGMCSITGCAEDAEKLTQIVVVVDSDLPVPDDLDRLQIEVTGTKKPVMFDEALDAERRKLPQSLGLVYSGGPLGPVRVVARGQLGNETVVERVAEVSFKKDRTLKLALPLTRSCVDKYECESADETCDQGNCVPAAMNLPTFDGNDGPLFGDAGPWSSEAGAADSSTPIEADGGADAGGDSGPPGPVCTINAPEDGTRIYAGDPVEFDGSCVGPNGEPVALQWHSTLPPKLGPAGTFTNNKLAVGTHEIRLCAMGSDVCAPTRLVVVDALPPLTAVISALAQTGSSGNVFRSDAELVATGKGTGVPPIELTWIDSFAGQVGTGEQHAFNAPIAPGKHMLRLRVKDGRDRVKTVERSFVVHAPDRTELFEAYEFANSVLSGEITAVVNNGSFHYVGTDAGYVYQVAADPSETMSPSVTPTGTTMPRPIVRGLFVEGSLNALYIATIADVQSCDITNATVKNCAKLELGNLGTAKPICVRRLSDEGTDYIVVGTDAGLWVGADGMLGSGTLREPGGAFHALAESGGKLWIAGSSGLLGYALGGGALSGAPQKLAGATGALHGLVASTDQSWAVLGKGFGRYDAGDEEWTTWTTSTMGALFGRLVSDDVRSIAITHPVIDGVAHDVIWIGTSAGLSRFDPAINSFTTYSKVDGLPDNTVLGLIGLPSNELLVATRAGLAIHRGQ